MGEGGREGGREPYCSAKAEGPPAQRGELMSHVEVNMGAGPREKTGWKHQEEERSDLGVSSPDHTSCRTWGTANPGISAVQ